MSCRQLISCLMYICFCIYGTAAGDLKVIYAINAGSHEHTDQNGINYQADNLRIGTDSNFGNQLIMIGRVPEQDEILYRTERYHTETFGYDLPLDGDGDYALILKFCEVYFHEPHKKVFDVMLNKQHTVVSQLDIFHQVGRGTAHDEYVFFTVANGKLRYKNQESKIVDNLIRLEFVKGVHDNPKINAFVLLKGDVEHIPRLSPLVDDMFEEEEDEEDVEIGLEESIRIINQPEERIEQPSKKEKNDEPQDEENKRPTRTRPLSGPPSPNPYAKDDPTSMLPICIAIGAFIPLLFCLCKL